MSEHGLLYRLFRRDIGRKLTALFLALLVYSAVDQQISDTQTVVVNIVYRDFIDAEMTSAENRWELVVVQREEGRPLIVPFEARQTNFRLVLSGSKTAIDQLRSSPPQLKYYPNETGPVQIELDDIDGIENISSRLATNGVNFVVPLELTFAEVDEQEILLRREHVQIVGEPAVGWEFPPEDLSGGLVFNPSRVTLSGPKTLLDKIVRGEQPVYRLDINGKQGTQDINLRFHANVRNELSQNRQLEPVTATVKFVHSMVPLILDTGEIEAEILLSVERRKLDAGFQDRLDRGEVCVIADGEVTTRALQILVPSSRLETEGKDGTLKDSAKQKVALHAYAHELNLDRGPVQIHIFTQPDFPSGWQVRFADPSQDQVLIEWRKPTPENTPDNGEETSE